MSDDRQYMPRLGQCRAYMLWSASLIHYASQNMANKRGKKIFSIADDMVRQAFKKRDNRNAQAFLLNIANKYHFKQNAFTKSNRHYWLKIFLFEFAVRKEAQGNPITYEEYGIRPLIKENRIRGIRRCFAIGKKNSSTKGDRNVYNTCHIVSVPMGGMNKRY